jgi:hypothetical protein
MQMLRAGACLLLVAEAQQQQHLRLHKVPAAAVATLQDAQGTSSAA